MTTHGFKGRRTRKGKGKGRKGKGKGGRIFCDQETKEKEKEREKEKVILLRMKAMMKAIGQMMNGKEMRMKIGMKAFWAYEDETAWESQGWDEWQDYDAANASGFFVTHLPLYLTSVKKTENGEQSVELFRR